MKGAGNRNGTQMIRPKPQQKTNTKVEKKPVDKNTRITGKGVRIGEYKDESKWRCKTCKFMN